MEYLVTRVYDGGRVQPILTRNATTVRGVLTIRQEEDATRHRAVLVARLTQANSNAKSIPPLYDVALLSSTGEVWTLTGHERILAGPLQQEHAVVQSWVVSPAPLEDLRKAEAEWARLAEMLARQAPTEGNA